MDLEVAIKTRRSIRKYDERLVEKDKILKIIEAGTWSPTACNLQAWKFVVIDDKNLINKFYEKGSATFLKNVNQAILVTYNNQTDNVEYNDYIQSASATIQNMLLMAHSLGVGTCWVNNLPNKKILRGILNIPNSYDPIALITLGYYSNVPNERKRKYELSELVSYNTFSFNSIQEKKESKVKLKRIARKVYKKLPCKPLLNKIVGKLEKKFDN